MQWRDWLPEDTKNSAVDKTILELYKKDRDLNEENYALTVKLDK